MDVSVYLKVENGRLSVEVNASDYEGNSNFDIDYIDLVALAEAIASTGKMELTK